MLLPPCTNASSFHFHYFQYDMCRARPLLAPLYFQIPPLICIERHVHVASLNPRGQISDWLENRSFPRPFAVFFPFTPSVPQTQAGPRFSLFPFTTGEREGSCCKDGASCLRTEEAESGERGMGWLALHCDSRVLSSRKDLVRCFMAQNSAPCKRGAACCSCAIFVFIFVLHFCWLFIPCRDGVLITFY